MFHEPVCFHIAPVVRMFMYVTGGGGIRTLIHGPCSSDIAPVVLVFMYVTGCGE